MKIFYFTGQNRKNKSGVSWKLWKIHRTGRHVSVWWGPVDIIKRRIVPGTLKTTMRSFHTEAAAIEFEAERIQRRRSNGYERKLRSRP